MLPLVIGGCVDRAAPDLSGPEPLEFEPLWYEAALAGGEGHDHGDFAQHANMSTPNFELLGWDPLTSAYGSSPGGSSCGDVQSTEDGRRIGAVKADDSRGVIITDITDPSAPQYLGELHLSATNIYDVAVTQDADHLVMVTWKPDQTRVLPDSLASIAPTEGTFHSACGSQPVPSLVQDPIPRPVSVLLVDIKDPSQPVIVDQKPIQGLGHGVFTSDLAGDEWVLTITENLLEGSRYFTLFEIEADETLGDRLTPVSVFQDPISPSHAASAQGHSDGWLDVHPVTGEVTGYFVAGTKMVLVDYSDPRLPTVLSTWTDVPEQTAADHNLHSIHTEDFLRDGRHYTYLGPENGGPVGDAPTGIIWVIDTTDPTDPREVAAWTLPYDVDWSGASYSPHYLVAQGDTLFVSMYHGGIWATDISGIGNGTPEDLHLLPTIGVFIPANEPPVRPEGVAYTHTTPNVFEVFAFEDGTMATFESNSGVYTFRFDASQPAPAAGPWHVRSIH